MDDICPDFHLISLNVRGLNNFKRRRSMFNWFRRNSADIIRLQETFSTPSVERFWKNEWGGNIVYNHGTNHSRGSYFYLRIILI